MGLSSLPIDNHANIAPSISEKHIIKVDITAEKIARNSSNPKKNWNFPMKMVRQVAEELPKPWLFCYKIAITLPS